MRRRTMLLLVSCAAALGVGALSAARRGGPDQPLATDPEMTRYGYLDGWIVKI